MIVFPEIFLFLNKMKRQILIIIINIKASKTDISDIVFIGDVHFLRRSSRVRFQGNGENKTLMILHDVNCCQFYNSYQ